MTDVLEQLVPLVRQLVERRHGIRTEARVRGHVLRADEHVDRVDLEPVHACGNAPDVGRSRFGATAAATRSPAPRARAGARRRTESCCENGPLRQERGAPLIDDDVAVLALGAEDGLVAVDPHLHRERVAGNTGFEKRASMPVNFDGSEPHSVCRSARPVNP